MALVSTNKGEIWEEIDKLQATAEWHITGNQDSAAEASRRLADCFRDNWCPPRDRLRSWSMLQVASVDVFSVTLTLFWFQIVFHLLLVNLAGSERVRDGERLTKSHGTRTRSKDSSGAWGAWSSTSKRDSRGISEEEVILQELKELILEDGIGEVRRHESKRRESFHRSSDGLHQEGGGGGGKQRARGGRQIGGGAQSGLGVKFERQVPQKYIALESQKWLWPFVLCPLLVFFCWS